MNRSGFVFCPSTSAAVATGEVHLIVTKDMII